MGRARSMYLLLQQQKSTGCYRIKLATTSAYIAASALTSHPSLARSFFGAVNLRAERTHLRKITGSAKAQEECDGEVKEYGVTTSAAKVHRCFEVKLVTTAVYNAAIALNSHPSFVCPVSAFFSWRGHPQAFHLNQIYTRAVTCNKSQSGSRVHVHGVKIQKGSMVSILSPSTICWGAKYDPAVSDSLIPVGRLIEAGFIVIHKIPSQAKEDGFSLKTVPLYGTITTPDGKTTIVMECAPLPFLLPLPFSKRWSKLNLSPRATSENCAGKHPTSSSFVDPDNSFTMLDEIDYVDNDCYVPDYLNQDQIEGCFQQRYKLMLKR